MSGIHEVGKGSWKKNEKLEFSSLKVRYEIGKNESGKFDLLYWKLTNFDWYFPT